MRVYEMIEETTLVGDERLYIVVDPTGTPLNRYVDIATMDARWAAIAGGFPVNVVAATGATETLTLAPAHWLTMDQNCTITFPTPTTAGFIFSLLLTGAFTPTLPASVEWADDTPPTYDSSTLFVFETFNMGTKWVGSLAASGLSL